MPGSVGGLGGPDSIGGLPIRLPIAPSGPEVSQKFPMDSRTITRRLTAEETAHPTSPRVVRALRDAALKPIFLNDAAARGANVNIIT